MIKSSIIDGVPANIAVGMPFFSLQSDRMFFVYFVTKMVIKRKERNIII